MVANIVVFASGSGSNFRALVNAERSRSDPSFRVRALFCDRKCGAMRVAKGFGIPVLYRSMIRFLEERSTGSDDAVARIDFDRVVVGLLEELGNRHSAAVDLIVLAGYMRIVHEPLLNAFPCRILNVHPADLRAVDEAGCRRYVGADPVYDALVAGERRTRSTVIAVDAGVDTGTIIEEGPWVDYRGAHPVTKEAAVAHQCRQKEESDWPALIRAVDAVTNDLTTDREWRCVESSALSVTNR